MKEQQDPIVMAEWLAMRDDEGLTYREVAERSGISVHTLNDWAGKFRKGRTTSAVVSAFERVDLIEGKSEVGLTVELPSGMRIHVNPEFSEAHLVRVIQALATRC